MSGSTTPPNVVPTATVWGAPIVSVLAYATFLAAIVFAFIVKNDALLITLCGMAGANATTTVSFWLGSSKGSQDKDARQATTVPPGATTVTTTPATTTVETPTGATTTTTPAPPIVVNAGTVTTGGTVTP